MNYYKLLVFLVSAPLATNLMYATGGGLVSPDLPRASSLQGQRPKRRRFKRKRVETQRIHNENTYVKEEVSDIPSLAELLSRTDKAATVTDIFQLIPYQYNLIADIAQRKNIPLDRTIRSHMLRRDFTHISNVPGIPREILKDSYIIAGFINRFTLDYPQLTQEHFRNFKELLKLNFTYLCGILEQAH